MSDMRVQEYSQLPHCYSYEDTHWLSFCRVAVLLKQGLLSRCVSLTNDRTEWQNTTREDWRQRGAREKECVAGRAARQVPAKKPASPCSDVFNLSLESKLKPVSQDNCLCVQRHCTYRPPLLRGIYKLSTPPSNHLGVNFPLVPLALYESTLQCLLIYRIYLQF